MVREKSEVTTVKFTPEEKEQIKKEAESEGVTISEFIRKKLFGEKIAPLWEKHLQDQIVELKTLLKAIILETKFKNNEDIENFLKEVEKCEKN